MRIHRPPRTSLTLAAATALVSAVLVATGAGPTAQASPDRATSDRSTVRAVAQAAPEPARGDKPTIVLVHGAFADSSGWNAVIADLTRRGYPVLAFSNPLRGPVADGEYLRQFVATIPGPVVLVGHSYGGAVISNAATGSPNVTALVFIAAYAPAEGESVAQANELGGGHTVVTDHLVVRPYPGAPEGDADAYIDPAWFHRLFAQDLPRSTTATMAVSQRPGALGALVSPSGDPAWDDLPSWYLVASEDRIIPPEAERAMARRAGSKTVVVDSSHVAMMSHPSVVTKLIRQAAAAG